MNRKERRAAWITEKVKIYNMSETQIKALKDEATKEATDKAFIAMLGLPLLTLRDEFGFGKKRLEQFMDRLLNKYECFDGGFITLEELKQIIKDETGVEIKNEYKRK